MNYDFTEADLEQLPKPVATKKRNEFQGAPAINLGPLSSIIGVDAAQEFNQGQVEPSRVDTVRAVALLAMPNS